MKAVAVFGPRDLGPTGIRAIQKAVKLFTEAGYIIRLGGAEGADEAALWAALKAGGRVELYLPWPSFRKGSLLFSKEEVGRVAVLEQPSPEAFRIAARAHPGWYDLKPSVQALHARNVHVFLGGDLKSPSRLGVTYAPTPSLKTGGTGHAFRVAALFGVPVVNLANVNLEGEALAGYL